MLWALLPACAVPDRALPTSSTTAVGDAPTALVVGDWDGDGVVDLATADRLDDRVSVLVGAGDGTFAVRDGARVGSDPRGIAAGDLDGDGAQDLVVSAIGWPGAQEDVRVLRGDGGGGFTTSDVVARDDNPRNVAVIDLDGDGLLDVLVGGDEEQRVSLFVGVGDGTLAAPSSIIVGRFPWGLVAADLSGDGLVDVATADRDSGSVTLQLAEATGFGARRRTIDVGGAPRPLAAADIDDDGDLDLVVGREHDVAVLLADGGDYEAAPSLSLPGAFPFGIAVVDLDGDSNVDVAVTNAATDAASVFLGRGDGAFEPAREVAVGADPFAIVAADFDADGLPDLAVTNMRDDTVDVVLGASGDWRAIGAPK